MNAEQLLLLQSLERLQYVSHWMRSHPHVLQTYKNRLSGKTGAVIADDHAFITEEGDECAFRVIHQYEQVVME